MAEATSGGLRRKVGPLPVYGWAAAGGGTFLVYYLYKRHAANVAGVAANGTTGGGTAGAPPVTTVYAVGPAAGASTSTLASWKSSVLAQMTDPTGGKIGLAQATLVLNDYLAGNPIPNQYANAAQALQNVLSNVGIAPGLPFRNVSLASPAPGVTTHHTPSEKPTKPTTPTRATPALPNRSNLPGARTSGADPTIVGKRGGAVTVSQQAANAAAAARRAYASAQAQLFPSRPIKGYKPPKATPGLVGPPKAGANVPLRQGQPMKPPQQGALAGLPVHPGQGIPGENLSPVGIYNDLNNGINDFFGGLFG